MKKLIALLLLTSPFLCKANTDSLDGYTLDAVDELLYLGHFETNPQQQNVTAANDGIFKKIWDGATSVFKPVWGEYDEEGHRSNGPYTVFQHHKGSISAQVVTIRQKILAKDPVYFTLYAEIYKTAINGQTANL